MGFFRPSNPELPPDVQALLDEEKRRLLRAEKDAQQAKEVSQHAWMLGAWRGGRQSTVERTTESARAGAKPALLGGPPPKLPDRSR